MKKNETMMSTLSSRNLPNLSDPELWDRISSWHNTIAADRPLVARIHATLLVENEALDGLILEYLRFTYLAWTSPSGATPSRSVGKVWQAHLLFTGFYNNFCNSTGGSVLPRESDDGDAYAVTLERYAAEFGQPPAQWWPHAARKNLAITRSQGLTIGLGGIALSVGGTLAGAVPIALGLIGGIGGVILVMMIDANNKRKPDERSEPMSETKEGGSGGTASGPAPSGGKDEAAECRDLKS